MTTGIPQQCLSCRFELLVNFGQIFALFLGACVVDFEYSVFIVNVIKCYFTVYLCGPPSRSTFMGVFEKHLVCNCVSD